MQKQYTVHSAHLSTRQGEATLADGTKANVTFQCFLVELVPDNHHSGTVTLEFHGDEIAAAREAFTEGASITLTLEVN